MYLRGFVNTQNVPKSWIRKKKQRKVIPAGNFEDFIWREAITSIRIEVAQVITKEETVLKCRTNELQFFTVENLSARKRNCYGIRWGITQKESARVNHKKRGNWKQKRRTSKDRIGNPAFQHLTMLPGSRQVAVEPGQTVDTLYHSVGVTNFEKWALRRGKVPSQLSAVVTFSRRTRNCRKTQ